MMQRKIIPDIVQRQNVCSLKKSDTALEGAKQLTGRHIAALVIVDDAGKLIGIVTERDMTQRLLAKEIDPKTTLLGDIMTKNPDTLAPDDSAADALELMQSRNYRHLPVTENGRCVAVVSIRDLYAAVKSALEEDIKETEAFVFGDRYGA